MRDATLILDGAPVTWADMILRIDRLERARRDYWHRWRQSAVAIAIGLGFGAEAALALLVFGDGRGAMILEIGAILFMWGGAQILRGAIRALEEQEVR